MEKTKITMNIQELAKAAAAVSGATQKSTREAINAVEEVIKQQLAQANATTDVEIKVFNGLTLTCVNVPAHPARDPRTGDTTYVSAKNRVRAKFGKPIKDAVNA